MLLPFLEINSPLVSMKTQNSKFNYWLYLFNETCWGAVFRSFQYWNIILYLWFSIHQVFLDTLLCSKETFKCSSVAPFLVWCLCSSDHKGLKRKSMCKFQKQNTHETSFCIALSCPCFSSPFLKFNHWPDWIPFCFGSDHSANKTTLSAISTSQMSQLSSLREWWKGMCEKKFCGKCADCVFDSGSLM